MIFFTKRQMERLRWREVRWRWMREKRRNRDKERERLKRGRERWQTNHWLSKHHNIYGADLYSILQMIKHFACVLKGANNRKLWRWNTLHTLSLPSFFPFLKEILALFHYSTLWKWCVHTCYIKLLIGFQKACKLTVTVNCCVYTSFLALIFDINFFV